MNLESISSQNLDKEMAYLFGVYLTDGCISSNGYKAFNFTLYAIDKDFVENTLSSIKKLIPECTAEVKRKEAVDRKWPDGRVSVCQDQYFIHVGFPGLGGFFKSQTGDKHHLPYLIWDAPLGIKRWMIAGMMDGDGSISVHRRTDGTYQHRIGIGGVEEGWIYEFQRLVQSLGVRTNKPIIRYRNKVFVDFRMNPEDFVSSGLFFRMKRKQDRLLEYIKRRSETKCHPPEGVKI